MSNIKGFADRWSMAIPPPLPSAESRRPADDIGSLHTTADAELFAAISDQALARGDQIIQDEPGDRLADCRAIPTTDYVPDALSHRRRHSYRGAQPISAGSTIPRCALPCGRI
jgi:hypothetical protein